jgi:thioredoxin reductase
MPATDNIHDTIILGSGPAGLTAAIYAARSSYMVALQAERCPDTLHD